MKYDVTIGLEIHAELQTKAKMFCSCANVAMEKEANQNICPVCTGQPGALPVANYQAIEWTVKTGLAMDCEIAQFSKFDRKNYFYPDLPKGYQISQFDLPFCANGKLQINGREIRIRRIHLEEDTGKLTHPAGADYSLVDYNRSGAPLMELVTEPDIRSADEAKKFCQLYQLILRYLKVSNADMEKGQMRCEVNISLKKPEDNQLGNLVEIKNINSFRSVGRAIEYEINRQSEILDQNQTVERENRGWDDVKGVTLSQRSKEEAHEYRYFPEPDLPPIDLSGEGANSINLESIKAGLPELPQHRIEKFQSQLGLREADAIDLTFNKSWGDYFEQLVSQGIAAKTAANWVVNESISALAVDKSVELLKLLENGEISGKIGKEILSQLKTTDKSVQEVIAEKGISHLKDESAIEKVAQEIITNNPKAVADFQSGKEAALKFLVGALMKQTKGQADPNIATELFIKLIKKG